MSCISGSADATTILHFVCFSFVFGNIYLKFTDSNHFFGRELLNKNQTGIQCTSGADCSANMFRSLFVSCFIWGLVVGSLDSIYMYGTSSIILHWNNTRLITTQNLICFHSSTSVVLVDVEGKTKSAKLKIEQPVQKQQCELHKGRILLSCNPVFK